MSNINRFEYLTPSIDSVVEGLEDHEKIYGLDQMTEYVPLRTLPGENGKSSIYRVSLTSEQRQMIEEGADILVEILHLGGPLAPSRIILINQTDLPEQEANQFKRWFIAQTKGPYRICPPE